MTTSIPEHLVGHLRKYADILRLSRDLAPYCKPFHRILVLANRAGARYYIQWQDPNNPEWLAEHRLIYQYLHPPQPKHVIRLDFFTLDPRSDKKNEYIGYVSLRPGPTPTIVECAVKPPSTDTSNHYLLCKSSWETRYPSSQTEYTKVIIKDICPFVQQDAVAGVCAHACIRTVTLLLSHNFSDCDAMTVEDVHNITTNMPLLEGTHLPSSGLMEYEIYTALEDSGAAPDLYLFVEGRERRLHLTLEQVIYPYIESGIPVIVVIETEGQTHGITVVGHTFDQDSWWQQAEGGYFPTLTSGTSWIPSYTWVPEFIVQDDNFGPYLSVSRTLLGLSTRSILVPTPRSCHVFLKGFEAESLVANYLDSKLYEYILQRSQIDTLWRELIQKMEVLSNVVLRPILVSRETLMEHLRNIQMAEQLSEIYQRANLPPWVWIVEISIPELYSHREKIGEIVLNPSYPSAHIQTGLEPLLVLRIFDITVIGTDFENPEVTTDRQPAQVLSRPTFGRS